jgi:hypothetical protein
MNEINMRNCAAFLPEAENYFVVPAGRRPGPGRVFEARPRATDPRGDDSSVSFWVFLMCCLTLLASTALAEGSLKSETLLRFPVHPASLQIVSHSPGAFSIVWGKDPQTLEIEFCRIRGGRCLCDTPTTESRPGLEDMGRRSFSDAKTGIVSAHFVPEEKRVDIDLKDTDGDLVWQNINIIEKPIEAATLEALQILPRGVSLLVWRQPGGGTVYWKAQGFDPGGQRLFAGEGVALREAASETEGAAVAIDARGQTALAWPESTPAGSRIHVWHWTEDTLQAPPLDDAWNAASCDAVIALVPTADGDWAILWIQSVPAESLQFSTVHLSQKSI